MQAVSRRGMADRLHTALRALRAPVATSSGGHAARALPSGTPHAGRLLQGRRGCLPSRGTSQGTSWMGPFPHGVVPCTSTGGLVHVSTS